jgi:hypothetical protein
MTKFRTSKEYMDGVKSFMDFAIRNAINPKLIQCPCKRCRLNKKLSPREVYAHLTGGAGILTTYTHWVFHGEKVRAPDDHEASNSNQLPLGAGPTTEQSRNMQDMLRDAFGMHEVMEDNRESETVVGEGVENMHGVGDEESARMYYNLLKKAEKPLHNKTKESKLSATVHLYNLKCVGGISNSIFSSLLEYINKLLPADDETLSNNTYESKKFLRDMGLGYEKIPAC